MFFSYNLRIQRLSELGKPSVVSMTKPTYSGDIDKAVRYTSCSKRCRRIDYFFRYCQYYDMYIWM